MDDSGSGQGQDKATAAMRRFLVAQLGVELVHLADRGFGPVNAGWSTTDEHGCVQWGRVSNGRAIFHRATPDGECFAVGFDATGEMQMATKKSATAAEFPSAITWVVSDRAPTSRGGIDER